MMMNFKRASYTVSRAVALAAVWLSVAPVFAGSYSTLYHPVQTPRSNGSSLVYKSNDVTVVYRNQFSNETQGDFAEAQPIDFF